MRQNWKNLLFAHWPLKPEEIRPLVPGQLELDLYDCRAWVAVAPFEITGTHPRGLPPVPGASSFPELNVRTYATHNGVPGIYFFSLDAASRLAVWGARLAYSLPYFYARMQVEVTGDEVSYESQRASSPAEFKASYRPLTAPTISDRGSLVHFLTERYALYNVRKNNLYRAEIHHRPWPLQNAGAEIQVNSMAAAAGITLPRTAPLLHFSKHLDVLIWPPRKISG